MLKEPVPIIGDVLMNKNHVQPMQWWWSSDYCHRIGKTTPTPGATFQGDVPNQHRPSIPNLGHYTLWTVGMASCTKAHGPAATAPMADP